MNYRTHRKVLVVDGTDAFTGGAGVADHWRGQAQDPELDKWRGRGWWRRAPERVWSLFGELF